MYALTFCYEGCDDSSAYATTIAVSEDKNALYRKMDECVAEDTREPNEENDEDEWCEDCNYRVVSRYGGDCYLQHKARYNLYTKYSVHEVEVIKNIDYEP